MSGTGARATPRPSPAACGATKKWSKRSLRDGGRSAPARLRGRLLFLGLLLLGGLLGRRREAGAKHPDGDGDE